MKTKNLLIVSLILGVLVLNGCGQQTTTKQPINLILTASDLPEGYSVKEKTPRLQSDVSKEAVDLGWEDGYYVRYARINEENIFDNTIIEQAISIYSTENIQTVFELPDESDERITYKNLPCSDIGDKCKAYRVTITNELEESERYYQIEFMKKNVYETFYMSGTATDYELLKELAQRAATKI